MLHSLTKIFLRGRVVHVKQHLLGQTLQLVLRMGHGGASLGTGKQQSNQGPRFQSTFQLNFAFIAPHLSQKLQKKKNAYAGKKNKYTDFRLKRFAKIQLQQIRTKPARSSERPSSLKNMQ